MLQFILGMLFGGFIAFIVIGITSINKIDDEGSIPQPPDAEEGDHNAGS